MLIGGGAEVGGQVEVSEGEPSHTGRGREVVGAVHPECGLDQRDHRHVRPEPLGEDRQPARVGGHRHHHGAQACQARQGGHVRVVVQRADCVDAHRRADLGTVAAQPARDRTARRLLVRVRDGVLEVDDDQVGTTADRLVEPVGTAAGDEEQVRAASMGQERVTAPPCPA